MKADLDFDRKAKVGLREKHPFIENEASVGAKKSRPIKTVLR